jgi:hypothetical protein
MRMRTTNLNDFVNNDIGKKELKFGGPAAPFIVPNDPPGNSQNPSVISWTVAYLQI